MAQSVPTADPYPAVIVAIDQDYEPMEFTDRHGQILGFCPDLIRAIDEISLHDFKMIPMAWNDAIKALEAGHVDVIDMLRTPEREERYDFSQPHSELSQAIFRNIADSSTTDFESLAGKRVGVERGDIMHEMLAKRSDLQLMTVNGNIEGLWLLNVGKLDAFAGSEQTGQRHILTYQLSNVEVAQGGLLKSPYCFALRKGNTPLLEHLNWALNELDKNGEHAKLLERWLTPPKSLGDMWLRLNRPLLIMLAGVGALTFLLLLGWNLILRRIMKIRAYAQVQLLQSKQFLQTVIDANPEPMIVIDRQYHVVLANTAAYAIRGVSTSQISCLQCHQMVYGHEFPCHGPNNPCVLQAVLREKKPVVLNHVNTNQDGTESVLELIGAPILDAKGEIIQIIQIVRDISDRRRLEQDRLARMNRVQHQHAALMSLATHPALSKGNVRDALLEIVSLVAQTFQCDRVGVWFYESEKQTLFCRHQYDRRRRRNELGRDLTAETMPQVVGALTRGEIIYSDHPYFDQWRAELGVEDGAVLYVPVRVRGHLHGVLGVEFLDRPHPWPADELTFGSQLADLVAQAIVNQERQQAIVDLKDSEEKYRLLVENLQEGIWVVDALFNTTFVNPRMARMLGCAPDQMLGRNMFLFMDEPDAINYRKYVLQEDPAGKRAQDFILKHKDGRKIHTTIAAAAFYNEQGEVSGALAAVSDVTDRRLAEQERQQLESRIQHTQKLESLGVLAGGIAHDFNNLLMGIMGNASLALMDLPKHSPLRPILEQVETSSQRAADLCKQMLAYSGRGKFMISPMNLAELVKEMANLLEVSISKKVTLCYDFAPDTPVIEGDATQIRQIVMNLITNASEAIGDRPGRIVIRTGRVMADMRDLKKTYLADEHLKTGEYAVIEVVDNGEGMDHPTIEKIFEPFFTTKFTGRGLGLAAVLGIVRGHHGTLEVRSKPGKGATFRVLLPCSHKSARPVDKSQTQPVELPSDPSTKGKGKVLVVDDEASVRRVATQILERGGYEVLTACDGVQAVEVYRKESACIDLIVLDMTMPHMDGVETHRALCEIDPAVRVVLSSGFNLQDVSEQLGNLSPLAYIQKPYRPADLLAKISQVLKA